MRLLDPAKVSLTGIDLGQAIVAIVAVTVISGEYGTGMIRLTLAATPRRWLVLAAKAAVVSAATLVTGAVAVLASVQAGGLLLARHGVTAAHGYQSLSLGQGPVLRAAAGSVLYLALIALFSLGIAAYRGPVHPGHHEPALAAAHPLAGPRRAGRVGGRCDAGRGPAAAVQGRLSYGW